MENLIKNFDEVYKNNYDSIFTFIYHITANRSLAEDITQEAFIKALKNIDSLQNESKISVWLKKIALNLFLDHKRNKTSRLISLDDEIVIWLADLKTDLVKQAEQTLMSRCVQSKMQSIPENYRIPLLLDIQGYSDKEIAIILGCSLENTKVRLHRGRKKLKEILGHDCNFYYDRRNVLC